jgi:GTP pyrophosphokinase
MFQADIMVTGNDDIGIVSRISDVISREMKLPMRSINVKTNDGLFEAGITVFVSDLSKLEGLMQQLRKVKGVKNVSRGLAG